MQDNTAPELRPGGGLVGWLIRFSGTGRSPENEDGQVYDQSVPRIGKAADRPDRTRPAARRPLTG